MDAKQNLKEIFQFGIYKLDHNLCTPEEINSWNEALMQNVEMDASIRELADFFNVSEQNVRTTIHRKLIAGPKRKVVYPFLEFLKIAPEKWRKK